MTHPFPERGPSGQGPSPARPGAEAGRAGPAPDGGAVSRPPETGRTYQLARPARLDLETFARATGTHPELVRRLVALGVLDAWTDAAGHLWFPPSQLLTMARVRRLRAGFSINYAALGLVMDLLDRIADLEAAQRGRSRPTGGPPWT
ncbi:MULTISPECIES: chaperone modulator CbpM [unclassified Streptosporangium]|uniref:chaperone modulator CbpM n=1 Tax=unclassified Streptosporangium TaxID=2632669 RepID=UPI002E28FB3B|nr:MULTISPECIES: chaperone modulator CbpM [unclassified Streptosporangium]